MKGGEKSGLPQAPPTDSKMMMMDPSAEITAPMKGGRRRRSSKRRSSKRRSSKRRGAKKGGNGVIATAAVPFGLLALQRYFKGSRTSKKGMRKLGSSFKRTFRRRH